MRRGIRIFGLLLLLTVSLHAREFVSYVNPLMGTESTYKFSNGNTYPAVAVPWGMNFWSPQTGENRSGWMYTYTDEEIRGFRQTHQPSPWINDYGTFSIMPVSGELKISHKERGARFSHKNEIACPDYYRVAFDNGTVTELSASRTGAIFDIAFASGKKQYLIVDAYHGGCHLDIDKRNCRITGYTKNNRGGVPSNFANYFILEFSHPIKDQGVQVNDDLFPGKLTGEHDRVCAYLRFDVPEGEKLTVRVASSFIGAEQARLNFDREVKGKTLADIRSESAKRWNEMMGRIVVEGGSEEQMATFYSCLYRVLLFPREFYEFDRSGNPVYYSPYDGKIHDGYMYTDNGFWDTFRAVHPLFTLVYPEVSERIMQALINSYEQSGFLPEWASPGHRGCMIGNNSLSLITDAWVKGIQSFDAEKALEAMIHQTQAQGKEASVGRNGFEEYDRLGYVPYPDYVEATAKTLEYAYSDWCLSRFAALTGHDSIAEVYEKKSQNYRNLFDASCGFMRAKNKNGEWIEPFYAVEWGGPFTEGSSWHYTWSVMHDVEGLARLMGGHEQMGIKLDSMFTAPADYRVGTYGFVIHEIAEMVALNMGQYAHGNQPVQHAIYLYNYIGQPWKAQYHVREVLNRLYNPGSKGYCGDEDNGQTSAWYVCSAMGFYPVCPGQPEYVVGAPLFPRVILNLPDNKVFVIDARNNSDKNLYIDSAKLNGKKFTRNYLSYDDISAGGKLFLKMSAEPNLKRGTQLKDFPYSYSMRKNRCE